MCVPNMLGGPFLRLGIPRERSAFHQDLDEVGKTMVDW